MTLGRLAPPLSLVVVLLSLLGPLVPSSAFAQDRLVRTHYQSGSSYYEQGRYEEALREFEEALRLSSPASRGALLFNIGQTQERLGHMEQAIASFRQYLEASPDADDAGVVAGRLRTLQGRLDATGITLEASEQGAHVLVDGADRGTTPLGAPVRVAPGAHEVRVEKEGFQAFSLRVTVPAGERVSVRANLLPTAPVEGVAAPRPEVIPRREPSGPGVLPWVFIGVGGIGLIGGGVMGALALGARNDANDATTGDRAAYDEARDRTAFRSLLADVGFGVAVVAGAVGIVLLLTSGRGEEEQEAAATSPVVVPVLVHGGAGVALAGSL
jgi:tetratricopeptide (TPR) repeat protein